MSAEAGSNGALRPAQPAELRGRKPRTETVPIVIDTDDGEIEVGMVVQGITARAYDDLLMAHQPTEEHLEAMPGLNWHPESFPVALVAASLIDPKMTEAEIRDLWADPGWNKGDSTALFAAALRVNTLRRQRGDVGKGSGGMPTSESEPATP